MLGKLAFLRHCDRRHLDFQGRFAWGLVKSPPEFLGIFRRAISRELAREFKPTAQSISTWVKHSPMPGSPRRAFCASSATLMRGSGRRLFRTISVQTDVSLGNWS
jgi:hypothetical protein